MSVYLIYQGIKSVFYQGYLVSKYRNDIEPAGSGFIQTAHIEVVQGTFGNAADLAFINCFFRVAFRKIGSELDLDKAQVFTVIGNDIDLAGFAEEVFLNYPVTLFAKVRAGSCLALTADLSFIYSCFPLKFIIPTSHMKK